MATETDIIISDCIDWMRFTVHRATPLDIMLPPFPSLARTGDILDRGFHGYNRAYPLEGGGAIMWHTEQPEMKYCIELPGQALAEVRRDGFEVEEIMAHLVARRLPDLNYKRIDFAFDLHNTQAEPKQLWTAFNKKQVKTTARTARFISSVESEYHSDTVEFGSRGNSPRFVRAYNKAGQLGLLWQSWLRMELEMTLGRVNGFAMNVLKHGRTAAGRRELSEAVQTSLGWFNSVLTGLVAPHIDVPRPISQPNKFTRETIIPFLKNHAGELSQETKQLLLVAINDNISLA